MRGGYTKFFPIKSQKLDIYTKHVRDGFVTSGFFLTGGARGDSLMTMNQEAAPARPDDFKKTLPVVGMAFFILSGIVLLAYLYSRPRGGSVVLPGGVTYLGPSPMVQNQKSNIKNQKEIQQMQTGKISVPNDAPWVTQTGKKYPYSFLYPSSLSLGVFPDDPFDAVTIFWGDTNPQENLLLRVENLKEIKGKEVYIKKPKKDYVLDWWKEYNWKGVADITEFVNSKGLKGYRTKYLDTSGSSPYDHVFFEVPNRAELVIWMSGKLLEPSVFDRLVDSVTWTP